MEIVSFGSSSRGNAFLFRTARTAVLVDAGFSPGFLRDCLLQCGIADHELSAILVTHEHADHIRGLSGLLRWHSCPVLATTGTLRALQLDSAKRIVLRQGEWIEIGDLAFQAIPVPHDANEPIGLRIATRGANVAFFTDLGSLTFEVSEALRRATFAIVEANHDRHLLEHGPYPPWLKRRIASRHGHLSNDEAAAAACLCGSQLQGLWLAHLSEENNRPELALACVRRRLFPHQDVPVTVLPARGFRRWSLENAATVE